MLKLRELTMQHHKDAERSEFAKKLVSGKVTRFEYYVYLYNMGFVYNTLENVAWQADALDGIESIRRAEKIWQDHKEMKDEFPPAPLLDSVREYMDYLMSIRYNRSKILAHVYVRHMGDLSGGQIISKRLGDKFPVNFYKFMVEEDYLKEKLKEKLNNDMAEEAMRAFDHAHYIFLELDKLQE
jgi:heme oxygenase